MSFDNTQNSIGVASQDQFSTGLISCETNPPTLSHPVALTDVDIIFSQGNDAAPARSYQEEIMTSTSAMDPGPFKKSKHLQVGDSPAIEESIEARVERLGRQRPEAFDSIWAEIGFVFSIVMSQVLTVSVPFSSALKSVINRE